MNEIKNSEEMLRFLNDLSKFTQTFSTFADEKKESPPKKKPAENKKDEKNPQSPTEGIADAFIQNILDSYLKKS